MNAAAAPGCAPVAVAPGVHWVGALDPALRRFDMILHTDHGTTYNAYVVRGQRGVAVIDTVKAEFAEDFFTRLEAVAGYEEIRTIVLNHLEPDHTGALPELLRRAPWARLVVSRRAPAILQALLKDRGPALAFETTDTDDEIDLGGRTLRFLHTPFLHWPDTQCTYLVGEQVLFSGDLFGCHYCDERLFNDQVGDFRCAFDDYYAQIMRPFHGPLRAALGLIGPLPLQLIAPAHGPILRDRPRRYLARYGELCGRAVARGPDTGQRSLLVFFLSAYGNTAQMAAAVAAGAESVAGVRVSLYELEDGDLSPFVDLIEAADGLALGSPTVNGDAVKPIWTLLASLAAVDLKGKVGAAFGSYGWSGEAVPMMEDRLRGLKLRVPVPGLRIKLTPTEEELAGCRDFGRRVALALTGQTTPELVEILAAARE